MIILGIESSCDECSAALVEDGKKIISNVVATQINFHAPFNGVVPEIASRKHAEWIRGVAEEAFRAASLPLSAVNGVAVTNRPGLMGALLVGLSFAKGFAWQRGLPFIACDHMLSHLYAANLEAGGQEQVELRYPFLGLLVSGGHTIICESSNFETVTVLGTTADDAVGEAFDKVAKHYGWGYPGGKAIDELAKNGSADAFDFPLPKPNEGGPCAVSYSGLKTAAVYQLNIFCRKKNYNEADIAASFQKAAVETLLRALFAAVEQTGITTIAAGGGVAANSYLRARLEARGGLQCVFPPPELCGDNAAMVAGLGYHYLTRGITSPFSVTASARVAAFRKHTNRKN